MKTVRFDDSLKILVATVRDVLGEKTLTTGVVLRDVMGRLAFFSSEEIAISKLKSLTLRLRNALGVYSRTDRLVASISEIGVKELFEEQSLRVEVDGLIVRVIDRRLVGADWLRSLSELSALPPRFVFASLKGGVGRTTALAVAAADLASQGKRVLAVDLDMEAPGLGAMLLDVETTPRFGLIDALVENGLAPLDSEFLADLVGPSPLADRRGRIDVIPAFGRRSMDNPGDVLGKIARAYTEDLRADGSTASILDQIRELIDLFASDNKYDVILLDARAGLHETAASAILGLGAHVFLFGLNEPQTFQGYSALLSHLCRLSPVGSKNIGWLERLTMVQGKAPAESMGQADYVEKCQQLFASVGMLPMPKANIGTVPLPAGAFNAVPWDENVSDLDLDLEKNVTLIDTVAILEDDRFRLFDPRQRKDLLAATTYAATYKELLERISKALAN